MQIQQVTLKHFRCFTDQTFSVDAPLVLLCGANGTGKTTVLEGIHYLCYLRSFRTHTPSELLAFNQSAFFIRAHLTLADQTLHEVQVGVAGKKRVVKVDQRTVQSYRDLMQYYRVVTMTQDDINLVAGEPAYRRAFLDQAVVMYDPALLATLQTYRHILDQRAALLQGTDLRTYDTWTQALWQAAVIIEQARTAYLALLEARINALLTSFFDPSFSIALGYQARYSLCSTYDAFVQQHSLLRSLEARYKRTLFGPHLDDMAILFKAHQARTYASRGQQRLVAALIRIAHVQILQERYGSVVLLLDDIMTDFDSAILERLLTVISTLHGQRIFTAPYYEGHGIDVLKNQGALVQNISS